MYRLTARLTIGSYRTDFVTSVTTVESWKDLTNTATITLPKKLTVGGKPIVEGTHAVFAIGDPVTIELGYNYQFDTVFQGYVSNVKTTIPLEIQCEDAMWLFKKQSYKHSFAQVTVKQLVDFLCQKLAAKPTVVYTDPGIQLGKFRINNATGAQVLEELRKTYGIQSFFRDGKMYVGFAFSHSDRDKGYQRLIPVAAQEHFVEDDLQFKSKNERLVKIKATCFGSDNKQFSVEAGDPDGQVIPLFFYHKTPADLKKLAEAAAKKFDFSGLEGTFTTFGRPYVRQGDAVQISDAQLSERNGTYLVEKVTREFGQDGYRQHVSVERRIS